MPTALRGILSSLLLGLNTALHTPLILVFSLAKLLVPLPAWRRACSHILNAIAGSWIGCNGIWISLTRKPGWQYQLPKGLTRHNWYLVTCNHQSWADIFIVQKLLNHKIPQMKFFLKQELIWVPVIGLAWWALDFPFMKRYSKSTLKKHPEKRGKDFETTRKACEKFRHLPVAIFNFMEGTRFTRRKHTVQKSPYQHLLRPRPGGTGYVLGAMGDQLDGLIDISIHYPDGVPGFWDFLCGAKPGAVLKFHLREIPTNLAGGDYSNNPEFRQNVQQWVTELWETKDRELETLAK